MAKKEVKENKQKSHYFKDMKAELKKVIWPTPKQLINNTLAVIAFTLVIAIIVFVLDLCFNAITEHGITKMQEQVRSSYQASHNSGEENNSTGTNETTGENNSVQTEVVENTNATNVEAQNQNSENTENTTKTNETNSNK